MADILTLISEIEHMLNQALFDDPDIRNALASVGITEDMPTNKRGLFRDQAAVDDIQKSANGEVLRDLLLGEDSLGSINRHEGAAKGGNQIGKLKFLRDVYGDLVNRLNAPANLPDGSPNPAKITLTEFKYAAYDVLHFVDRLTQGHIKDADGNVIGVMGNTPFKNVIARAYYGTDPATGEIDRITVPVY